MVHELGTMLHCSCYGSYFQDITIHQHNVTFDVELHGSSIDKYWHSRGQVDSRTGSLGALVTYCDMWTDEWETNVWLNNKYIVGTKEYNE
jgi:hypothetical protein